MRFEKLNIKSGNIIWRMLELTPTHKALLEKWKVKVKRVFKKDNTFWILQKCNANMFEGVYVDWNKQIPSVVAEGIRNQDFVLLKK